MATLLSKREFNILIGFSFSLMFKCDVYGLTNVKLV